MNQGDLFKCINKNFRVSYDRIASILSEVEGAGSKDTTWVNRCANQHYPGDEIFKDLQEFFYEKFFATSDQANTAAIIRDWLNKNNLTFSGIDSVVPDKWLKHMIKCALSNWTTCRAPSSRSNKSRLVNQTFPAAKFFIGREKIISEMKGQLEKSHIVVLYGMAGIGKSIIAREFADRNRDYYSCVQEVMSDFPPPPSPPFEMERMILKLSFDGLKIEKGATEKEVFKTKFNALKKIKTPSLLIFDGLNAVPDDFELLSKLLKETKIHIVITTRELRFFESFPNFRTGRLESSEELRLFEHHLGRKLNADDDRHTLDQILHFCDGNPICIEHIAKYISMRELTFEEAMNLLLEGDPFPHTWYIQKDHKIYTDESFYAVLLKILFPNSMTELRKKVLKALSLLPSEGVSRRLVLETLPPDMQDELIRLESEGYVMRDVSQSGRTVTRLPPILQTLVQWAFFETEKDCEDFLEGLYVFMRDSELKNIESDVYNIEKKILNLMNFREFDPEIVEKWLDGFKKFFKKRSIE